MQETLIYLSYIGIIVLVGLLVSVASRKIRIPSALILLLVGMVLGKTSYGGRLLMGFPPIVLTSIAALALIAVVFDAGSRIRIREIDTLSMSAFKLAAVFFVLNSIVFSLLLYNLYIPSFMLSLLFAVIVSGVSSAYIVLKQTPKAIRLLEIESTISAPLMIIISFFIFDIIKMAQIPIISLIAREFSLRLVAGIGAGVLIGLIAFRLIRKIYHHPLSPPLLLASALLTYAVAESINGNGVVAVMTAALLFGNVYSLHKKALWEFSETFADIIEMLIFVLIGFVIRVPLTWQFLVFSFSMFLAYILVRFLSAQIALAGERYTTKEKLFVSLAVPKDIATAAVLFTLAIGAAGFFAPMLEIALAFMIYSLIFSTIAARFSKYFTKFGVE